MDTALIFSPSQYMPAAPTGTVAGSPVALASAPVAAPAVAAAPATAAAAPATGASGYGNILSGLFSQLGQAAGQYVQGQAQANMTPIPPPVQPQLAQMPMAPLPYSMGQSMPATA